MIVNKKELSLIKKTIDMEKKSGRRFKKKKRCFGFGLSTNINLDILK